MKLSINYDLMEEIEQANKGYSLSREFRRSAIVSTIGNSLLTLACNRPLQETALLILLQTPLTAAYDIVLFHSNFTGKNIHQKRSLYELKLLCASLNNIGIDTSTDLLLQSKPYHTSYKLNHEKGKIPYVLEEKYIMIPTVYGDDEQDVSLLQEHKIGSSHYSLSKGSPAKKLKLGRLAYNQ